MVDPFRILKPSNSIIGISLTFISEYQIEGARRARRQEQEASNGSHKLGAENSDALRIICAAACRFRDAGAINAQFNTSL